MRHGYAENKLGRNSRWRMATVRDLAKATLIRERICTTKAKAKEARKLVERLITLGKKGTLAHRRRAFAILGDHQLVSNLFEKTAPRFRQRQGGYTRIIPLSLRRGDNAHLTYLELTEKKEIIVSKTKSQAVAKEKPLPPVTSQEPKETLKETPEKTRVQEAPKIAPQTTKPKFPNLFPKRDKSSQEKGKSNKSIVGGFKKMFTKKPSE